MIQLFISFAQEDSTCAAQIHRDLEAQGYRIWQNKQNIDPAWVSYRLAIENGICGSAAVILVWSAGAAQSDWVAAHLSFAQRLKKPVLLVVLDGTDLPNTLVDVSPIISQPPCDGAAAQLTQRLPPADSQDTFLALCEQAADERISQRKAAIQHAAEMLERGEQREKVLALLEYIADKDMMMGVREAAQKVLDAESKKATAPAREDESRHIFGAKCRNGHITYFDKRRVCPASGGVMRNTVERGGVKLDELYLKCGQCGEDMIVRVDCEGYK